MRFDLNYESRAEFTIFYLARMTGSPHAVLQADNSFFMGWWAGNSDSLLENSWVTNGGTWDIGWALYALQYSQVGTITFSRNGYELGSWYNNGGWGGPRNFVFNW